MKRKKFQVPHQYVIIIAIVALAALATYIIPAGQYDSIEINGRNAIDATTFHFVAQSPVSAWKALLALPRGIIKQAEIICMLFMISGSMGVINATGTFDASIGRIATKYKDNLHLIIPVLMACFAVLGTVGINTPILAFIPLGLLLGFNLGGDALVGVSLALMGMHCRLAGGAFCTTSTGVAQKLIGLTLFSGWQLRLAATFVFWLAGSWYLIRYTKKVQKNPEASYVFGVEGVTTKIGNVEKVELTPRRIASLIVFIAGFSVVIYGATHGWSTSDQIPAVFMITAVICGVVYGFSANEIARQFVNGAKQLTSGAIVVGFAAGIGIILTDGNVIHTVVHALCSIFTNSTTYIAALGMFICNLIINFFICSSSGQATTVIPIFSAMGDVLHITQQSVVQTFNFGDGLTNVMTPISNTLMGSLAIAGIPFDRWIKFVWKWTLMNIAIAGTFVLIGVAINYGPF